MDMEFSAEDKAFREEVRAFLAENLPDRLKVGAKKTPGVFVEPDIGMEWHRILHDRGWVAYHWPKEDGGTGWTPTQKFIFEKECALAGAPGISILGLRLVGPVICAFGTQEQKDRFLPGILSGEDYWCQGYSEPGSGSISPRSRPRRLEGDEYIVNGSKIDHSRAPRGLDLRAGANQSRRQEASGYHFPAAAHGPGGDRGLADPVDVGRSRGQPGLFQRCAHLRR